MYVTGEEEGDEGDSTDRDEKEGAAGPNDKDGEGKDSAPEIVAQVEYEEV